MGQVVYSRKAIQNLLAIRDFYNDIDEDLALRVVETIRSSLHSLAANPLVGRPVADSELLGERIVRFGRTGFVALYETSLDRQTVIIAAVRHQRQSGYANESS